jgi:hypothetical protein
MQSGRSRMADQQLPDALIVGAIGQIAMGHLALLCSFQARRGGASSRAR